MIYVEAKSILSPTNNVNLYRGCSHGCIYCDTRSLCYQVRNYEEIEVKKNAIVIFENELKKKREKVLVHTGSMCDPYIHLEEELKLTRQMLEKIAQYGHGVYMLTKSDLILRDLDIYRKINENNKVVICMTLTTFDDELCKIVEPDVCVTSKRLEALKKFKNEGIMTGVWLSPLLPFINDNEHNIKCLIEAIHQVGVSFIVNYGMGMTLREGNREYYYEQLDKFFPGLKEKYIKTYSNAYIVNSLNEKKLSKIFQEECEKYGIIYEHNEIHQLIKNYHNKEQLSFFDLEF